VALEPLENSVKKPHQKELVARRLKYLRTKGIRITNTSKVRAAKHDRSEDGDGIHTLSAGYKCLE
jgi:hypothetical protein